MTAVETMSQYKSDQMNEGDKIKTYFHVYRNSLQHCFGSLGLITLQLLLRNNVRFHLVLLINNLVDKKRCRSKYQIYLITLKNAK